MLLLLLLLSRFSRVWLCATPQTAAHQAPVPGILQARTLEWVAHFLLQCMKVKSEMEVTQSCPTLHDPMDCSPPGSSVHGILQTRILEWGAIAFISNAYIYTCHTGKHLGSQFPNQGLNLCPPAVEAQSLNHWTTREVPNANSFCLLNAFGSYMQTLNPIKTLF